MSMVSVNGICMGLHEHLGWLAKPASAGVGAIRGVLLHFRDQSINLTVILTLMTVVMSRPV